MSRRTLFLTLILLILIHCILSEESVSVVTYGSLLKLEHVSSGYRLHSHNIAYGTGSGQQSVTGFSDAGDPNSLWLVKGPLQGEPPAPKMRTVVKCGDVIRLQHLATGKNLHSHQHRAPMNSDFEVSGYSREEEKEENSVWKDGDTGDNWILHCDRKPEGSPWERFKKVYLQHVDTKRFLVANAKLKYGDPIPNQLHVSGAVRRSNDAYWKANEGVFYAPTEL